MYAIVNPIGMVTSGRLEHLAVLSLAMNIIIVVENGPDSRGTDKNESFRVLSRNYIDEGDRQKGRSYYRRLRTLNQVSGAHEQRDNMLESFFSRASGR